MQPGSKMPILKVPTLFQAAKFTDHPGPFPDPFLITWPSPGDERKDTPPRGEKCHAGSSVFQDVHV